MRSAIYRRISTEEQSDFSLSAQEAKCLAYITEQGWHHTTTYTDDGISGATESRPALDQLLDDARIKRFDTVIVHDLSRLARSVRIQENILHTFMQLRIRIIAIKDGFDSNQPQSMLMAQFMAIINQQYRDNLRWHTQKGLQEKAKRGYWVGTVPWGYRAIDKDNIVPDDSAPFVTRAFTLYATGQYSLSELADHLNTIQLRHCTTDFVRAVLSNRAYLGYVSCGDEYVGNHEPIIDQATFDQCQAIKQARSTKRSAAKPNSVIRGLAMSIIHCATCGGPMWQHVASCSKPNVKPIYYYRCAGNRNRTCNAPMARLITIDQMLLDILSSFMLSDEQIEQVMQGLSKRLPAPQTIDRKTIQERLDRLTLAWTNGNISDSLYQSETTKLKALFEVKPSVPVIDIAQAAAYLRDMPMLLTALPLVGQRRMVQKLLAGIWVSDNHVVRIRPTAAFAPLFPTYFALPERDIEGSEARLPLHVHYKAPTETTVEMLLLVGALLFSQP